MDDELELTDPEHPDAKEAAASTARLLVHLRDKGSGLLPRNRPTHHSQT